MRDLVAFLNARLRDDEAQARSAAEDAGLHWDEPASGVVQTADELHALGDSRVSRHVVLHDPARVLAEVEAKRRLIRKIETHINDLGRTVYAEWGGDMHKHASRDLLRLLALPYAEHEDYHQEWKPTAQTTSLSPG